MSSVVNGELRILIIDDNPAIHQDFIKMLASQHEDKELEKLKLKILDDNGEAEDKVKLPEFIIETALQGQEGVEKIKQALKESKPYSLAFVDIRMPPGWDGIETIKHIWALDPNIQVVICTAYSDYTWEQTVKELGATDSLLILKKPFDITAVRQLAHALIRKWQLSRMTERHELLLEKEIKEKTESLVESLSILRATIESSNDGIIVIDGLGNILDHNEKFKKIWGIPESIIEKRKYDLVSKHISTLVSSHEKHMDLVHDIKNYPNDITTNTVKLEDGKTIELYSQPYVLEGKVEGRVCSFRDISSRVGLEEKIEFQATHDSLTKLPNRALLLDRLEQAIERCKRIKKKVGVLFLDLDRFKSINDSLSHAIGDELLISAANRLSKIYRKGDTFSRIGGDEFVYVLPDINKKSDVVKVANKLLDAFRIPFPIDGKEFNVTASIGICIYPEDGSTVGELLQYADLAMYKAKDLGRNRFQFYTKILNQENLEKFEIEHDLRHALENDEFFLVYQPQYSLNQTKLLGVEALIRWKHPVRGIIQPLDFIPVAEISGLVVPIGDWVLKEACKQGKKWQDLGYAPIDMAVNITTPQIKWSGFVESVKATLDETGFEAERLELELTENIIINNTEAIDVIIKLKKDLGVKIVLDDFGSGNSTLHYLRTLPIDILKIDQSFIKNIETNRSDEVIVKAILEMAKHLNLEVIAEGIETETQLKFLTDRNCQEGQGFFLGEPLTAERMLTCLDKEKKK